MEATGLSVGKSVLDGALSYAKSAIAEEVTLQLGVQRDQGFIRDELEMMQSFLLAADKDQHGRHHDVLKTWVKQVRDVAYDVEDCLQDYAVRLGKKPSWWQLPCTAVPVRHRIANEMKELRAKVEDVSNRNNRYNLLGRPAAASKTSPFTAAELQSTTIDDIGARRAAMQQEKVDLVDLFTRKDHGLRVIAAWESAAGAAAVVRVVRVAYQKVKGEFECHAWVKLMHPFDAKEFIGSLVRQFKANSCENKPAGGGKPPSGVLVLNEMESQGYDLLHDFSGYVTSKRYLVVLNGLSTIEDWDWIRTYLPDNDNGSRILVCTQQAEVAIHCTEDGYKVSEMEQEGPFIKPLYVFYKEDYPTELKDKTESSSKSTSTTGSSEDKRDPTPSWSLQPVLDEPELIKQKEPKSEVIELISKGGKVIAIWGMGDDVGKSTDLVTSVYESLGDRFQKRAWFSIKRPFSHEEFLKDLESQLLEDYCKNTEGLDCKPQDDAHSSKSKKGATDSIMKLLSKTLLEQKCLLVLNDISLNTEWDSIVKNLPNERNPASRIIVTTREFSVAMHCSGEKQYTYKLEILNGKITEDSQSVIDSNKMKSQAKSNMDSAATTSDNKTVHFEEKMLGNDPEGLPESSSPPFLNRDSNIAAVKKLSHTKTAISTEESQLIGRIKEKDEVIELLSDCNTDFQVISVWGMGGIGKTTLVKSIYQSSELEKLKFERRAWVTILRPFQPAEVLRSLAERLVEDSPDRKGEFGLGFVRNDLGTLGSKDLSGKLLHNLNGKKYLIVLDDLSSPTEWDEIKKNLPENNNGSRIIITTRPQHVARHCSKKEKNMRNIEGLTDEDALELFLNKVSKEGDESELKPDIESLKEKDDMMEEAKIIIKKCGRLPLAVAAVGGFLSTRPQNITEWRNFSDQISEELDNNPSFEMIKKILTSSYEGLPYHLKSCFLYLSIFPEDHDIRYGRLLSRWVAEGYSRATRNKSKEKKAEEQFTALLNKSMIQQSRTIASGKTGFCQVHDLMREIIVAKSEEENLVLVLDDHITSHSKEKARHLVVSQSWSREKKNDMEKIVDVSHIRSLTVFGEWRSFFLSKQMRMLRVLDLEDTTGLQYRDLVPIGKFRHLKYLSLRGCVEIFNLPGSLGKLLNLETLDIRGTFVTKLPATIGMLQNLKYLRAGIQPDDEDDTRSVNLIPTILNIYNLNREELVGIRTVLSLIMLFISGWLRNLDLCGVKVPRGIGRLRSLHTLSVVNIARGKAMLKNLEKLTQLRKLGVTGINKNNCKELCSAIVAHGHLQSLLLRAEGKAGLEGCLDKLSLPPKELESLQLYGNLVKLPEWIGQLENLHKLSLRSTNLDVNATMQVLGELPKLAILRFQDMACKENELCFRPDGFGSLKKLELVCWKSLESAKFEGGATPKLEVLLVDYCWHIDDGGFPGIENLERLKEVSLQGSYYTVFKEQLQKQLAVNKNKPNLKIL